MPPKDQPLMSPFGSGGQQPSRGLRGRHLATTIDVKAWQEPRTSKQIEDMAQMGAKLETKKSP